MSDRTHRVPLISRKKRANSAAFDYDAWLQRRQVEDRYRSLLRRLECLADDARIERLDKAADLLQQTAERFRLALSEKFDRGE